jgi:hypothetical protein
MKQDNEIMRIRVAAEHGCWPLWWEQPYDMGNVDPEELGLSPQLCQDLTTWSDAFDATANDVDASKSGFASSNEEAAFHQRGRQLTARLQTELSNVAVVRYENES